MAYPFYTEIDGPIIIYDITPINIAKSFTSASGRWVDHRQCKESRKGWRELEISKVMISFHSGEPMMLKPANFAAICRELRDHCGCTTFERTEHNIRRLVAWASGDQPLIPATISLLRMSLIFELPNLYNASIRAVS